VGVLGSYFEAGEAKNRAFACLGAGQPLGFIFGLVVGALLTQSKAGWRGEYHPRVEKGDRVTVLDSTACFFVQAGLAALFVVIGYFTIPATFTPTPPTASGASTDISLATLDEDGRSVKSLKFDSSDNKRVDWVGTVLSVSGLVLLTFALA
jgi:MFS family permease